MVNIRTAANWLGLCILAATSVAGAQRVPISIGHWWTGGRFLYERPLVSPWIGADIGIGMPVAKCQGCPLKGVDPSANGSIAAGVTFFSRFAVGFESDGMKAVGSRPANTARMRMVTGRLGVRRDLFLKGGYGEARYRRDPVLLVDDRPAWMVGGEYCRVDRIEGCSFVDYSQSDVGSVAPYNTYYASFRMRAIRIGFGIRAHALRGRRITLPQR